jgi:uncharacterized protein (TIGR02145 family)
MKNKYLFVLIIICLISLTNGFSQIKSGTFVDFRDNQKYKWVDINNTKWMAQNLNFKMQSDSWCYNNDSSNCEKYGRLYTFMIALNVCPSGWHLPSKKDYEELIKFFGNEDIAAKKITKIDSLGLNVLLAGWRSYKGSFANYDDTGLWTSTSTNEELANGVSVSKDNLFIADDIGKICGYYVRCIKDK